MERLLLRTTEWVSLLDTLWEHLSIRRSNTARQELESAKRERPEWLETLYVSRAGEVDDLLLRVLRAHSPTPSGRQPLYDADMELLMAVEERITRCRQYIQTFPANHTHNLSVRLDEIAYVAWVYIPRMLRGLEERAVWFDQRGEKRLVGTPLP